PSGLPHARLRQGLLLQAHQEVGFVRVSKSGTESLSATSRFQRRPTMLKNTSNHQNSNVDFNGQTATSIVTQEGAGRPSMTITYSLPVVGSGIIRRCKRPENSA